MRPNDRPSPRSFALLPLFVLGPCLGAEPALDARFEPIAFLVGHCWRAPFPDGKQQDLQCFEPLYDGKLISNTHVVQGSDPVYEGMSVFSWDDEHDRVRFHYFTSTGAVSEGYFRKTDAGYVIPEKHVGRDGKVTELENLYQRDGEYAYRVVSREKTAKGWEERLNLRYVRTDAPEAPKEKAALSHDGGDWRLAWSSHRDGNWEVYRQEADGAQVNLTRSTSNEWAWNTRGASLMVLSDARVGEEPKGWRGYRLDGARMQRLSDEVVADGYVDCTPDGARCAAEARVDGRKRIVFFDQAGKRTGMVASDQGDDADPTFSPDGRTLLFRSNRAGHWDIYRGDADGANPVQLTKDASNDSASRHEYGGEGPAHFSPDGTRIAWMRKFPGRGYDVWVMDADGSDAKNLTESHTGSDAYPSFSPDGRSIAFDSDRDGGNEIYVMAADGSAVRRITISPGGDLAPMWVRVAD